MNKGLQKKKIKMRAGKHLNFYGRKRGKKLSGLQEQFISNYLPKISLGGISYEENPSREKIKIEEIFGEKCPVWLEIGFGGGEHLLAIAKKNTNNGIIGCEPYVNGVAMLLPRLEKENLTKVRIFMDDARVLLEVLPDVSIEKLFLLFPDPWPKTKHKRRRLINKESLQSFKRVLMIDALIYIATDVDDYVKNVLEIFYGEETFEWIATSASDWRNPWEDWEATRYFEKAKASGRKTTFLIFKKI